MKAAEAAKAQAKAAEDKAKKEAETAAQAAKAATSAKGAASAAAPAPAPSAADTASSWRAAARPPTVRLGGTAGPAHAPPATPAAVPTKILAREPPAPVQTSKLLPRGGTSAAEPPVRQAAWRPAPQQPARPLQPPRPAPPHQLPPHLAAKAAAAQVAPAERAAQAPSPATAPVSAPQPAPADDAEGPSPSTEAAAPAVQAAPSSPPRPITPPTAAPAVASPPVSPASQERRAAQQAKQAGYKVPAVSQFDDLMSRIKGVMTQQEEAAATGESEKPIVKLPSSSTATARRASARAEPATPAPASHFVVALPTASRGRGRGRSEVPRAARQAAPTFENREPILPIHSSSLSRPSSPPPAWRQYTVRIAPHPPRRAPPARAVKNFQNPNFPRPLYPFSWSPQLRDVNPRRLSRDDSLLPRRYDKSGAVIYTVSLPKQRIRRRPIAEKDGPPAMVVKISSVSLVRQPAPAPLPPSAQPQPAAINAVQAEGSSIASPVDAVLGYSPFGMPDRRRAPESGSWRRNPSVPAATPVGAPDSDSTSTPTATSRFFPGAVGQAVPAAVDAAQGAPGPSDLNGEKVETTPRKETTAPGLGANGAVSLSTLMSPVNAC